MKHEWRENEADVYLPEVKPVIIDLPKYKFLTLEGKGNPDSESYTEIVVALYAMSYGIKTCKKAIKPEGYFDYTVYPIETLWDIKDKAEEALDNEDISYKVMIRQPDFVSPELVEKIRTLTLEKKSHGIYNRVNFEEIEEGKCVQALHLGSYKRENETFEIMEKFAATSGVTKSSKAHRKIYLSDARKANPEKLKTVLRFQVEAL
ncbi:MAG: GyrI-like domain-containing protein [Bacteroidales bacterium]|jgi:hypothetical protein|nr:GyrI-like domain-containing protein [Bacteroidales bacterium]